MGTALATATTADRQSRAIYAFHLAMLIAALLCGLGAAVNGIGIRNTSTASSVVTTAAATGEDV